MVIEPIKTLQEAIRQGYAVHQGGGEIATFANEFFEWCKTEGRSYL